MLRRRFFAVRHFLHLKNGAKAPWLGHLCRKSPFALMHPAYLSHMGGYLCEKWRFAAKAILRVYP